MQKKYDVGILGVWYGCNYGSIVTYYSLYSVIKSMGKSVLMIHRPWIKSFDEKAMEKRDSMKFARKHYDISKAYNVEEIGQLNQLCDAFVLGSDQLWNYGVTRIFGHSYFLDFAGDDKKKIAYATSFGSGCFRAPWSYSWKALRCMRRLNSVSVREKSGVRLCRNLFGVQAEHTLDPVLLCPSECLANIARDSSREMKTNYIAAYILDPDQEKREALLYLAEKLNKDLVVMLDGWPHLFKKNREAMGLKEKTVEKLTVNDWIFYIKNCDFMVTDSFHGSCMAILFQKQFYAVANPGRGTARFESLMELLKLKERYVERAVDVKLKDESKKIDYQKVDQILEEERQRSKAWLEKALFSVDSYKTAIDRKQKVFPLRMLKSIMIYYAKTFLKR